MEDTLQPTIDPIWVLVADGFDRLRESSIESRFAISNGFLGIRGTRSTTRGARWVVPARTYVAGLFDTSDPKHATTGLVPAADWLRIRILLPDGPLVSHPLDISSHRMALDFKRGVLLSEGHHVQSESLGLHVHTLRLVSLRNRAIGLQLIRAQIEHGTVEVTLEALFEGINLGLVSQQIDQDVGVWHTQHSGKGLAMASAPTLQIDGNDLPPTLLGQLKWSWNWKTRPGQVIAFQRFVAIVRSDSQDPKCRGEALESLAITRHKGWRGVVAEHEAAWATRWQCSDVTVAGDAKAQLALRFALYHLNSAANPADDRVSIGARALTGDDYRGHVFWDTEIFLLPFYTLTWPEAARSLLMYRFYTLDAAREKAARMGWRGALYAWESADTGEEMTPDEVIGPDQKIVDVLCGKQEQHISADIAYAVWQYWRATGDDEFLLCAGAEILLETGQFWSSRAQLEADGCHHIRGVIGPDEYHEHVDDNAYTNVMARWNIERGLDVATLLRRRWPAQWDMLSKRLGLDDAELQRWRNVAQNLATGLVPESGLFQQFSGYFTLEDVNLASYAGRTMPMDVVLGRDRTQTTQVVKQADVVALLALLPDAFPPGTAAKNFDYYEPRCGHGSSLSPSMHGLVAARLGRAETALRFFRQTADIDLGNSQVAADGGVHIAALGGLWMMTVFGFAGLTLRDDGIAIDPKLPASWHSLAFSVQWRGRRLRISINRDGQVIEATLETGEPMALVIAGAAHTVRQDHMLRIPTGQRSAFSESSVGGDRPIGRTQ